MQSLESLIESYRPFHEERLNKHRCASPYLVFRQLNAELFADNRSFEEKGAMACKLWNSMDRSPYEAVARHFGWTDTRL